MSRVDDVARKLLDEVGITEPAVDIFKIADHLGLTVALTNMPADVSGMLIRDGELLTVGLNKEQSLNRRRFTLAHEVGHLRLHRGRPLIVDSMIRVNYRDAKSARASDREEMEANGFAAALLTPAQMVIEQVDVLSRTSKPTLRAEDQLDQIRLQLARKFKVSVEAMGYRLVNLGITS